MLTGGESDLGSPGPVTPAKKVDGVRKRHCLPTPHVHAPFQARSFHLILTPFLPGAGFSFQRPPLQRGLSQSMKKRSAETWRRSSCRNWTAWKENHKRCSFKRVTIPLDHHGCSAAAQPCRQRPNRWRLCSAPPEQGGVTPQSQSAEPAQTSHQVSHWKANHDFRENKSRKNDKRVTYFHCLKGA